MRKRIASLLKSALDRVLGRGSKTIKNKVNGWDVEFEVTKKELKKYKKESKKVEKMRKKLLKKIDKAVDPNMIKASTQTIVKFVPAKNIPIEKLGSKKAFDRKLEAMIGYDKKTFFVDRAEVYRENIITALRKVYHSNAEDLVAIIKTLNTDEIQLLLLQHPGDFSIDYIYFDGAFGNASGLERLTMIVKTIKGNKL